MEENISEVELAYQILSESGKENPLYFKKLIREVIARKNITVQNEAAEISEIYTMINMDSRFQHIGDGIWGLTDWYPPETKRSRSSSTKSAKTATWYFKNIFRKKIPRDFAGDYFFVRADSLIPIS